ncbi:Erythromycin esterase [Labilithrix luteola]|uniref:Erythromycin esterase n=1 Tax=Labilithrix luteola TaxID=1391654 RepID=A0A0K1PWB7_9BACT|nr:erythromycin esterase family protein [Labilithrix luteola]AKU97815.1 Erythromycin esterase [Labilithrix luteola]
MHRSGSATKSIDLSRSESIDLSLSKGNGVIEGVIRDESGHPRTNVAIRLTRPRRNFIDDVYVTTSSSDGRFQVNVPKGTYVARAELDERTTSARLIELDDQASVDMTLDPRIDSNARIAAEAWSRKARSLLATTDPTGADDDLATLTPWFEGARIVGLGESTHGSRETFQLKHRIIRRLVEKEGFSVVALEANRGELKIADDYVRLVTKDEAAAVRSLGFWTWRTQELQDLLRWLREHNAGRLPRERVRLVGIDIQSTSELARSSSAWARKAGAPADMLATLELLEDPNLDYPSLPLEQRQSLLRVARALEAFSRERLAPSSVVRDAIGLARGLEFLSLAPPHDFEFRDRAMADNVLAELDSRGTERVVLWAHAGHVARGAFDGIATMGEHLARARGDAAYRPVLIGFRAGIFRAIDASKGPGAIGPISSFELPEAPNQTLEAVLASGADRPIAIGLRDVPSNTIPWFEARIPTRWAGGMFVNERATTILLAPRRAFDGIIIAPRSSPSIPATAPGN